MSLSLRGYENTYRIRVGVLRIVYEVNWDKKRILIHFIGSRERAYE
jgi:mRNA-degrading endonuclease RelE of RelBE toxin-antitoxin system